MTNRRLERRKDIELRHKRGEELLPRLNHRGAAQIDDTDSRADAPMSHRIGCS